jgi:hypothetical protein
MINERSMDDGYPEIHIEGENEPPASRSRGAVHTDDGSWARQRLQENAWQLKSAVDETEKFLLTQQSEAQAAEHEYATAAELGDVARQAAATKRLSAAEGRIAMAESRIAQLRSTAPTSGSQFEDFVATRTEPTARWLREHRDWAPGSDGWAQTQAAHQLAVSKGHQPDTQSYFDAIENTLNIRGNGSSGRSSSSRGGDMRGGSNTVHLTKSEVEMATSGVLVWNVGNTDSKGQTITRNDPRLGKPIGTNEYARRKQSQIAQGLHNKLS